MSHLLKLKIENDNSYRVARVIYLKIRMSTETTAIVCQPSLMGKKTTALEKINLTITFSLSYLRLLFSSLMTTDSEFSCSVNFGNKKLTKM